MIPCYHLYKKLTIDLHTALYLFVLGSMKDCKWNLYCKLNINKIRKRHEFLFSFKVQNGPCKFENLVDRVVPLLYHDSKCFLKEIILRQFGFF